VWGEQAGSVCSLGPARAEDADLNMLVVSFFHLAYALLMALCPEFLGKIILIIFFVAKDGEAL